MADPVVVQKVAQPQPPLIGYTKKLDDELRIADLRLNRTAGGLLSRLPRAICRHSPAALVVPALLCGVLVLGNPHGWFRLLLAIAVAILTFIVLIALMSFSEQKKWPLAADLALQVAVIGLLDGVIWIVGSDEFQERGLYVHLFVPLSALLALTLLVAALSAPLLFKRLRNQARGIVEGVAKPPLNGIVKLPDCLGSTELFHWRGPDPVLTKGTIITSFLVALFRSPLELLILPSIAAVIAPPPSLYLSNFAWLLQPDKWADLFLPFPSLYNLVGIVLILSFIALFIAGLNERFEAMWTLTQTALFRGGALVVSLLVIALAVARCAGVLYVSTVLDSAAAQVLLALIVGGYAISWFYDYWSNRLLAEEILRLIDPNQARGRASIPYPIDPFCVRTRVPEDERVLQVHGSSRFIVIRENHEIPFFQAYSFEDLINTLATSGAPGGRVVPPVALVRARIFNFHTLIAALFIGTLVLAGYLINKGEQHEEWAVKHNHLEKPIALATLLTKHCDAMHPAILIAGSGGGTRAALYTASILEGIHNAGHSDDVVMGSGISGGGAALAYFGSRRLDLIPSNSDTAWNEYFNKMKQPFIQDVLQRSTEWRILSGWRLGTLLDKSFQQRWGLKERNTLGSVEDFGLALNSSLAGHFSRPPKAPPDEPLIEVERKYRDLTKSSVAGDRLIYTNLKLPERFAGEMLEPGAEPTPIIINDGEMRLETAAALNANFPPVFPNAAIDVENNDRYWVTDGGAADNRGLETLLYALRDALQNGAGSCSNGGLPYVYVVVADTSAFSESYTQDRGISSAAGAGAHFASKLDVELKNSIEKLYGNDRNRFGVWYIFMPQSMRTTNSFGTHWMLQKKITIQHEGDPPQTLKGDEVISVMRALHKPGEHRELSPEQCKVAQWAYDDAKHSNEWRGFMQALHGSYDKPNCILKKEK